MLSDRRLKTIAIVRGLGTWVAFLAAVAACSGSGASPSGGFQAPSATSSVPGVTSSSDDTSAVSSALVDPSGGSLPSEDKDLEARLPDSLNGVPLIKGSFRGDTILGDPEIPSDADLRTVVASFGKTPDDYSEAIALDITGALDVSLGAMRLAGVDGRAFLEAYVAFSRRTNPTLQVSEADLGRKAVTQLLDASGSTYIYPMGDTLFYVLSGDPALAAAALATLP